ncbi:unnamed protein product, partial [marine sediment metagenome]
AFPKNARRLGAACKALACGAFSGAHPPLRIEPKAKVVQT